MAQTYTINGVAYSFPDVDDSDWGQNVTDWAGAVSSFLLQRSGGTFTLSAEVDFGSSYGLLVKDLSSKTTNPATAGFLQLAKTDVISWRNNANDGNLNLEKGTDDLLQFNSIDLVNLTATQTLTSKTITGTFTGPLAGAVTGNVTGNLTGNVTGDVTGDITGDITGNVTGNASTATALQTARTIGGTSFDGTGNIAVALASAATALQTARTIGGTSFDGTSNIAVALASEATALETARTIGGTSFDGTANIAVALSSAATILETARTISMTGDVTWSSGSFDGSGNVTAAATLAATQASVTTAANLTTVGALAAGSIASGFGAIDNGTDGIKSNVITATTNIELDHQGSDPAAPGVANDVILYAKEKKVYTRDGAGTITELGAGGGAGDADTIQLKTAEASEGTGSAPWYTGNDLVPGGGGTIGGTWELSTSNPLINTNDATKVFHYSNGTSNRKGDYFEIELDVPNYAKGHNLVVQLFYRTVGAEDTDFLFFARDRTADYSTQANGAQGATNNVVVDSSTGFAVGDRICFEDSSNARHFRYVTAVPDSTHVTFSGAAAAFADDAAVVTKFFTDELNFITAENNTTNYEGKIRKWAFQINDTTTKIRVGFLYDNSATSTNELFFDQILLSSNQFLQVSSQGQSEYYWTGYQGSLWSATGGATGDWNTALLQSGPNTPAYGDSKLIRFSDATNQSVTVTRIYAKEKINLEFGVMGAVDSGDLLAICDSSDNVLIREHQDPEAGADGLSIDVNLSLTLAKEDYVYVYCSNMQDANGQMNIRATPLVNDVILLNSQSEIFTDWNDSSFTFSDGSADAGSVTIHEGRWRRVGSDMEVYIGCTLGSSLGAHHAYIELPSGYSFDTSKFSASTSTNHPVGNFSKPTINYNALYWMAVDVAYSNRIYLVYSDSAGYNYDTKRDWNHMMDANQKIQMWFKVPIAGWNASFNPVLSMPLVDLGNTSEAYKTNSGDVSNFWNVGDGNTYQWDEALLSPVAGSPSLASSSLITIADITSGSNTVTAITAKQDIIIDVSLTKYQNTGSNIGFYWGASNTSLTLSQAAASSQYHTAHWGGKLSAGDYIYAIGQAGPGSSSGRVGGMSLTAQKIMSGNMAHIIKPAVMTFGREVANGNYGGNVTAGQWNAIEINIFSGETWFATKGSGSLGVGGTNVSINLEPGMYEILAQVTPYAIDSGILKLYDQTNSVDVARSNNTYSNQAYNGAQATTIIHTWTVASTTEYRLFLRCSNTKTDYGFGVNFSLSGYTEKYLTGYIRKLK